MPAITPQILTEIASELPGDDWEAGLARQMKVTRRTVNRWRDGECEMPPGIWQILETLVERQIATLTAKLAFLRH